MGPRRPGCSRWCSRRRVSRWRWLTRDYAYFVENRLRMHYGLDGIPVIIDFVERTRKPRSWER